ncbi:MAG: oligosaccharide flippase family protein, partial [Patescibacteria group bacterium]
VILVYLCLQLGGALAGPVMAAAAGYLLASWQLRKIKKNSGSKEKTSLATIWREAFSPVLLTTLTLTIFFTMDVVLVRHFFPAVEAGEYAALANLGKVGYYIVGPIMMVMFPLISARANQRRSYLLPLLGSLVLSLGASLAIIFIFLFFGQTIINLLYGQKYLGAVPYLSLYSFYMAIYGLNAILTYFVLSISYYRPIPVLFLISLLQGVLIFFFHQSIFRVIGVNIIISALYFLVITIFILWKVKSKPTNFL